MAANATGPSPDRPSQAMAALAEAAAEVSQRRVSAQAAHSSCKVPAGGNEGAPAPPRQARFRPRSSHTLSGRASRTDSARLYLWRRGFPPRRTKREGAATILCAIDNPRTADQNRPSIRTEERQPERRVADHGENGRALARRCAQAGRRTGPTCLPREIGRGEAAGVIGKDLQRGRERQDSSDRFRGR